MCIGWSPTRLWIHSAYLQEERHKESCDNHHGISLFSIAGPSKNHPQPTHPPCSWECCPRVPIRQRYFWHDFCHPTIAGQTGQRSCWPHQGLQSRAYGKFLTSLAAQRKRPLSLLHSMTECKLGSKRMATCPNHSQSRMEWSKDASWNLLSSPTCSLLMEAFRNCDRVVYIQYSGKTLVTNSLTCGGKDKIVWGPTVGMPLRGWLCTSSYLSRWHSAHFGPFLSIL